MKHSYDLAPDDRADESVRKILRHLSDTIGSKIEGVLEDSDVECLHDLRVANRRTRTVLSQIKGVLEPSAVKTFSPEFKWLGVATGPCRDLDVILLEMRASREELGSQEPELDSFHRFLKTRRRTEHELLVTTLRSPRFCQLLDGWHACLASGTGEEEERPLASSPIIDVAGPRILNAFKRIRKRGADIDSEASAALLHRLRIDGKKLRYLLEFFSDLYPSNTVTRCIKELKRIQDILGEFNDTEVQLALIKEFAKESPSATVSPNGTSRRTRSINERQSTLRTAIVECFWSFVNEDNRRLYKKTFRVT